MTSEAREVTTDVLIVGSGGAALRAALEADSAGASVLAVIKGEFRKSGATFHSVAEIGAFNVPDGAGDKYLVFRACFSSKPRSHVIQDHFKPILKALGTEATRRGIKVMDRLMIVNLIAREGECLGAHAIDADGKPVVIRAKSTILTTGGASQLFAKNLYPSDITGDGYAMAHRAGARLVNLEFMQAGVSVLTPFINLFGNYLWDVRPNLTDRDGKPFLADYLPRGIELDDVIRQKERHFPFSASDISRYVEISIQQAINDGRGTPEGGVYMDFVGRDFDAVLKDSRRSIAKMWPLTYEWYKQRGVDLYRDKVQITCSAHAINGGLYIDSDAESNLKGLFAAGEVAAGPHGADRLGGNMAMTCQVFGRRAGIAAARRARGMDHRMAQDIGREHQAFMARFKGDGSESLADLRSELQAVANRHLLIIRDEAGLSRFKDVCRDVRLRLLQRARIDTPEDLVHAIELDNLADVGELMATAALARRESRGGHYRRDFPESDPAYEYNLLLDRNEPGGVLKARLGDLSSGT